MKHPLALLCTPLPSGSITELENWRHIFEAALAPWLDARQFAHVRRFGRPPHGQQAAQGVPPQATKQQTGMQEAVRAGLSRLLARAQLLTYALQQPPDANAAALPQIGMDISGRPLFPGWHAAFSHSHTAAFCALAPSVNGSVPSAHALDAEALVSTPPESSAFSSTELLAPPALPQVFFNREALRRWTIKEALLKASGIGLGMNPASVPTGSFGQRAGVWHGPLGAFHWRNIPCPGHWLCLSGQSAAKTHIDQHALKPRFFWLSPHTLLRRLSALCQSA